MVHGETRVLFLVTSGKMARRFSTARVYSMYKYILFDGWAKMFSEQFNFTSKDVFGSYTFVKKS